MSEQNNNDRINLPPLPKAEELEAQQWGPDFMMSDKWFEQDIEKDFLNFSDAYTPPRYTLERNDVPFANIGELHVVSGKAGHGKTNLMSQMMAAILGGQFGNTVYCSGIPEPVVLYIDTEMGKDDTIAIKNRVCCLAGIPYDKPCDKFYILRLRETEEADIRWRKILKSVWVVTQRMDEATRNDGRQRCLHLFLDGLLDVVKDYNDQVECQPIIRKCMKLATYYDTSMWIVQHENPMADKLVGTLGSILERKVSEIFTVRKIVQSRLKPQDRRSDRPSIYFKVDQLKARGRDVESWEFQMTTDMGWGMPREITDGEDMVTQRQRQERKQADDYFKTYDWPQSGATYKDCIERNLRSKGVTSNRRMKKIYDIAMEANIIYKNDKGKYFYNGLDGMLPDDEVQNIQFSDEQPESCPY